MANVNIEEDNLRAFYLRTHDHIEIDVLMNNLLEDWLNRNEENPDLMNEEYIQTVENRKELDGIFDEVWQKQHGDREKGIQWGNVFLPNGTQVRSKYKGEDFYAAVINQNLMYKDEAHTPSQFACRVAGFTSRNAWRDLWVKRPLDKTWNIADALRRGKVGYYGMKG